MGDTVLGNRYKIEKKIGEGGMAYVYEAKDKLLNRVVAVKVLRPEFVDDQEFLKKFKREAEAVASLSHPNIVNVYDVGEDGKVHYIVMEYVNGKNLKEIIQEEGTLDEYTALDITKQIAMALGCAHKRGIIHRDIKPHNILISNEGRNIAKVADFGIAKAVSNSTMTNIGGVIGSVHYFSPEQAKGKFVTNNADLYSLGIVLYEMLTGKLPFRGDTPVSIALQHINDDIEFTEEEKIRIPQSVRTIIKKLTEKNSADRYQTAEELIEDIEYIEKNIDLDFIKEYDDFATKHIDERNLNTVGKPRIAPAAIADIDGDDAGYYDDEDEYEDDEYDEEEEDYIPQKKRKKKKKKVIKEETPKTKKRLKIAAVILSLILLAQVGLFFKLFGSSIFGSKDGVVAPNVEGMQVTQAESTLEEMGLKLEVAGYEYSYSAAENEIISQDPDAGTELKEGDTVTVVVSKGNNNKEEPNVIGMTLSQAQSMIQAKGFAVGKITYEFSSAYKEGTVLGQSTSDGKISLIVSKGEDTANKPTVPNPEDPNAQTDPNANNGNNGSSNNGGSSSGGSNSGSSNNGGSSSGGDHNSGGSSSGGESSGGSSGGESSGGSSGESSGGSSGGESSGGSSGESSGGGGESAE